MHDKLKLLLDKISLPEEYYEFFNNGKILKLKLDHTRRNGIFVIEIDNPLDIKVLEYIDQNMKNMQESIGGTLGEVQNNFEKTVENVVKTVQENRKELK